MIVLLAERKCVALQVFRLANRLFEKKIESKS